jgi:hypothetical protein
VLRKLNKIKIFRAGFGFFANTTSNKNDRTMPKNVSFRRKFRRATRISRVSIRLKQRASIRA